MTTLAFEITAEGVAAQKALDTFVRKMRDVQGASKAAGQTGAQSAEQLAEAFDRLNTKVATLPNQFRQVGQGSQAALGSVANLTAQFNDIGVTLASGQSPFLIAIQQGTQISQIFGGQGVGAIMATLKGAFLSLLSPVSLLTIGLIAGGGALVQWLASAGEAEPTADNLAKTISTLTQALDSYNAYIATSAKSTAELTKQFGEFAAGIQGFQEFLAGIELGKALDANLASIDDLKGPLSQIAATNKELIAQEQYLAELRASGADAYTQTIAEGGVDQLRTQIEGAAKRLGILPEEALRLYSALEEIGKSTALEDIASSALNAQAVLVELYGTGLQVPAPLRDAAKALDEMAKSAAESVKATEDLASDVYDALNGQEALNAAASGLSGYFSAALGPLTNIVNKLFEGAQAASDLIRKQAALNYIQDNQPGGTGYLASQYAQYGAGRQAFDQGARESQYALPSTPRASRSGGAAKLDDFDTLVKQAEAAMTRLDVAIATVNEKVRAGLLTTAEGVGAVASAKKQAADQLAGLIPQIDAVSEAAGPKAAGQVEKWRAALQGLAGDIKTISTDMSKTLSDSFASSFADFITGSESAGDAFEAFGKTVIDQLAKIAADKFTASFITPLIDGLFGSILPSAQGNVIAGSSVMAFAKGGLAGHSNSIVRRPTLFGLMGEAGPEAILPFKDGGVLAHIGGVQTRLPLKRGAGGVLGVDVGNPFDAMLAGMSRRVGSSAAPVAGGGSTVVNISTPAGTQAEVSERNEGGSRVLDVMIREVQGRIAADLGRGVGPLSDVLGANFGVRRRPGGL